jgi:protein-S-isoprenylcysteine O-methyltransferase Ste14
MTDIKGDRATVLDWIERLTLFLLFGGLLWRIGPSLAQHPFNILLLISDGLVVGLTLLRSPTDRVSRSGVDLILAMVGTAAPLLAVAGGHPVVPGPVGNTLMVLGLGLSFYAKLTLWRSFGLVAANRGVKRHGPYRMIRHPMYLGYFISQMGFALLNPAPSNLIIYAAAFGLQIMRMRAEEGLLGRDPVYADYMSAVRYRLAPGLF